MTDLRTAALRALEALEYIRSTTVWQADKHAANPAITALKAALEQPYAEQARRVEQETHGRMRIDPVTGDVSIGTPTEQEQEPVYWEYKHVDDGLERWNRVVPRTGQTLETAAAEIHGYRRGLKRPYEVRALYTHPPRREPLSDEELDRLWREPMSADWEHREFARAVEAAHGIKEKNHE
jgi:hypothetical protein